MQVTRHRPARPIAHGGLLKDGIKQVEHIDEVVELTFSIRPDIYAVEHLDDGMLGATMNRLIHIIASFELFYETFALRRLQTEKD